MKRMLLTFTLALSLFGLGSFAADVKVSPAAIGSFNASFKTAAEVKWTVVANYYKASFFFNGQYVAAYYDADGNRIGVTRNITSLQLPITLQAALKNDYPSMWVSDLFEAANDEGTTYYMTLENADTKLILKSVSDTQWRVYKKQDKS